MGVDLEPGLTTTSVIPEENSSATKAAIYAVKAS